MPAYDEKIKELEDLISKSNKRTQHAIGLYKAQLAKLKEKQEGRRSGGKAGDGYSVRKSGDGTALLLGFPSVGKSTLLNDLTGAKSEVGAYEFTTLTVVPGVMKYNHAKIQILDVPGIVKGAASGRGRGKEVLAVMRNADLALVLVDVNNPQHLPVILNEVYDAGIRLNQRRPDIKIKRTAKDGLRIGLTVKLTKTTVQTMKDVLKEFRINNADVVVRTNVTIDQFIDCIQDNKVYMPSILVLNKIDLVDEDTLNEVLEKTNADLAISASNSLGIEKVKQMIFEKLNLIRLWLKEPGKEADMEIPLIVFKKSTIKDVCNKLHKDFVKKFKFARVWGKSSKFPGQKLMLHHVLKDNDILELHMR